MSLGGTPLARVRPIRHCVVATDPNPRWQINEGRLRSFRDTGRLIAFVCECGQSDCNRTVPLSPAEYETCRRALILHAIHDRDPG